MDPHRFTEILSLGVLVFYALMAWLTHRPGVIWVMAAVTFLLSGLWKRWCERLEMREFPTALCPPRDVTTVFFSGNFADATQLAFYTGINGFQLTDGSRIWRPGSLEILYNPWLGAECDGADATPYDAVPVPLDAWWVRRIIRPLFATYYWAKQGIYGCVPALRAPWRINLAQEGDVKHGLRIVRNAMYGKPKDRIVLFGTSRGAAVALRVTAALTPEERSRIMLVVLEGVFDDVERVVDSAFTFPRIVRAALAAITSYRPTSATALEAARQLSGDGSADNCPQFALISSKGDRYIHEYRTSRVFAALLGKEPRLLVHYLVLERSPHGRYTTDNDDDRRAYLAFMEQVYTQCEVPRASRTQIVQGWEPAQPLIS